MTIKEYTKAFKLLPHLWPSVDDLKQGTHEDNLRKKICEIYDIKHEDVSEKEKEEEFKKTWLGGGR